MGQSPFSSVSSMSMDTTTPNTPVLSSAPTSNHGDRSPNRRLPPPQQGRSTSGGYTVMVNPCPWMDQHPINTTLMYLSTIKGLLLIVLAMRYQIDHPQIVDLRVHMILQRYFLIL